MVPILVTFWQKINFIRFLGKSSRKWQCFELSFLLVTLLKSSDPSLTVFGLPIKPVVRIWKTNVPNRTRWVGRKLRQVEKDPKFSVFLFVPPTLHSNSQDVQISGLKQMSYSNREGRFDKKALPFVNKSYGSPAVQPSSRGKLNRPIKFSRCWNCQQTDLADTF